MPLDPLAKATLGAAGKIVLLKVADLLPNNDRRVGQVWTAMLEEALLLVEQAFREHLAHHEEKDPQFADRLAAALDEREARALFYRLGTEAAQATTTERMRMLAHALAGLYTPDLDAEMRSRVSRAVLALEPSDVITLRKVLSEDADRGTASYHPLPPDRAYEALVTGGCIQDDNKTRGGLYVTALGCAVAKALELWR